MGIYTSRSGLVLGFHGCEQEVRDRVIHGIEPLTYKNNPYDWLGNGNYFWENNLERAWDFARNLPGGRKYKHPAVLGAVIDLDYCLDLLDAESIHFVQRSFILLQDASDNTGFPLPENKPGGSSTDLLLRHLDCAVIENLHIFRQRNAARPFDSVRGMFPEGRELYSNAGFRDKNHIQICVRNPNCIKGYFVPRTEVIWPVRDPSSMVTISRQ